MFLFHNHRYIPHSWVTGELSQKELTSIYLGDFRKEPGVREVPEEYLLGQSSAKLGPETPLDGCLTVPVAPKNKPVDQF